MNSRTMKRNAISAQAGTDSKRSSTQAVAANPSRLNQLQALLVTENGATIADMTTATGWQAHSVRGAMAGALKKRGVTITSEKIDGVRRYRGSVPA